MVAPERLRLCLVTDPDLGSPRRLADIVLAAVGGGVTLVQLRDKRASTEALLGTARMLRNILSSAAIPLVINDRVDVALAAGAEGVHLGQRDMPVGQARAALGPGAIIGLSIDAAGQEAEPDAGLADYFGVGPVFATGSKTDAAAPLGLDGLAAIRKMAARPIVAIGGISAENAGAVIAAGADGVAVISAIMASAEPEFSARAIAASVASALQIRARQLPSEAQ